MRKDGIGFAEEDLGVMVDKELNKNAVSAKKAKCILGFICKTSQKAQVTGLLLPLIWCS